MTGCCSSQGRGKRGHLKTVDFRLYLISDRKLFRDQAGFLPAAEEALKGGVKAIQLREKDMTVRDLSVLASDMRRLTARYGARLFINDRADVALAVGADGVHLGRTGMPPRAVRQIAGSRLMIGVSTHSVEEVLEAEDAGADFLTFGPVYATPSKLRYGPPVGVEALQKAAGRTALPVFAIGGIKEEQVQEVTVRGAAGVALISGILAAREIRQTTERYLERLS